MTRVFRWSGLVLTDIRYRHWCASYIVVYYTIRRRSGTPANSDEGGKLYGEKNSTNEDDRPRGQGHQECSTAHWTVTGKYDYIAIGESPSEEIGMAFNIALSALGNVRVTTINAFTTEEFAKMVKMLPWYRCRGRPSFLLDPHCMSSGAPPVVSVFHRPAPDTCTSCWVTVVAIPVSRALQPGVIVLIPP